MIFDPPFGERVEQWLEGQKNAVQRLASRSAPCSSGPHPWNVLQAVKVGSVVVP